VRVGRWSVVAALAFAACATLGPKEHEDLRAVEACGGTPRLRSNIARVMSQYRLSMPDTVLAFEFHTERWEKSFGHYPVTQPCSSTA
jgi:hypothetical protein